MVWVIAIFVVICAFLVLQIIRYRRQLKYIEGQLCAVAEGSSIIVTSNIRGKTVPRLCNAINNMLMNVRKKEVQYKRSENQLKQAISSIAHDIRTPLTSAIGYMQMLDECTEDKRMRYQNIVSKRLVELKNLLEELFLYSKMVSDDFEIECESVSVFQILSECMVGLYPVFEEQKIEPIILFENENVCVNSNQQCLERVFKNIINNAILHGSGGLKIEQSGKTVRFSNPVTSGQEVDTEKMFDRFYKEDAARRKGSSGLGLAIVKELVEKMDGSIKAEYNGGILMIGITLR